MNYKFIIFLIIFFLKTTYAKKIRGDLSNLENVNFIEHPYSSSTLKDSSLNTEYNFDITSSKNLPLCIFDLLINGKLNRTNYVFQLQLVNDYYKKIALGNNYSKYDMSGRIKNAYFTFSNHNFDFTFGRFSLFWGQSKFRSIISSGHFPSTENILIRYNAKRFNFELYHGQLSPELNLENIRINRNFGGHKLSLKLNNSLSIAIGEYIIYTGQNRGIELIYLNPYVPYFLTGLENSEQPHPYMSSDNDNSIIFSDFRFNYNKNVDIFGEVIIDDLQIDKTGIDNALGFKIGIEGVLDLYRKKIYYNFDITQISKWTYIHNGQFTTFQNMGHPIGFKFGPDSKYIGCEINFRITDNISFNLDTGLLKKGENNLFTDWNNVSSF